MKDNEETELDLQISSGGAVKFYPPPTVKLAKISYRSLQETFSENSR